MTEDAFALMNGTYREHTNFTYSFQKKEYVNKERALNLKKDIEKKPEVAGLVAKLPN